MGINDGLVVSFFNSWAIFSRFGDFSFSLTAQTGDRFFPPLSQIFGSPNRFWELSS